MGEQIVSLLLLILALTYEKERSDVLKEGSG